jgi:hypothetical protein
VDEPFVGGHPAACPRAAARPAQPDVADAGGGIAGTAVAADAGGVPGGGVRRRRRPAGRGPGRARGRGVRRRAAADRGRASADGGPGGRRPAQRGRVAAGGGRAADRPGRCGQGPRVRRSGCWWPGRPPPGSPTARSPPNCTSASRPSSSTSARSWPASTSTPAPRSPMPLRRPARQQPRPSHLRRTVPAVSGLARARAGAVQDRPATAADSRAPSSQQASRSCLVGVPVTATGGRTARQARPVVIDSTARTAPVVSMPPCTYRP